MVEPEPTATTDARTPLGVMTAACVSTLIVNANTSAVAILLPAISDDVGMSTETLQWAVTGYLLVGAATIVTSGSLGDVFGRRKVFLGGLLLFIASCVLIALAPGGWAVIVGRCIQGAAGATLVAGGLSILTIASPPGNAQLRAVSYWGSASAVGAAAGPLLGGALVNTVGWQGLFWLDAAIAVLLVPLTLRAVAESSDPTRSRSIDWAGSALIALALAPLILGLTQGATWGWLSIQTLGCFAVSVASTIGFVAVESKVSAPLIDLGLFRNRRLVGATIGILIGAAAINAMMFLLSLFFQDPAAFGMDPFEAGLATLPATVGMVALTPAVPGLTHRFGVLAVVGTGFVIMTAGFVVLALAGASWGYLAFLVPIVMTAVGLCLSNNPCSSVATGSVDHSEVGGASGLSNMARYVGPAVMTAVVAALYAGIPANRSAAGASATDALLAGFHAAALALAVVSALGIVLVWLIRGYRDKHTPEGVDVAIAAAAPVHTVPRPETGPSTATRTAASGDPA
ncbi:MFS transporter [Isoptericola sp. 178]|uniref:MFS transporter n=1 Tax=Isoptericola sp. 178 TaxID=3064651 RepID=UPI002712BCFE|nr:MFS transporter [Isoptericola sp. 178]MDO8145108.1 MFS transporter [Isoptericola sp. 178]